MFSAKCFDSAKAFQQSAEVSQVETGKCGLLSNSRFQDVTLPPPQSYEILFILLGPVSKISRAFGASEVGCAMYTLITYSYYL